MQWCTQHSNYNDKTLVRFALTNNTPLYLPLTGKLWVIFHELYEKKMTAIYWEWTELQTARLVLDNMSSAIIVFICKTKAVQYSHELTWRYWHIHVAPCHSMVQIMLINIVSSGDYFIFSTKFEENKIENFEKMTKIKKMIIFRNFCQKSRLFRNFPITLLI